MMTNQHVGRLLSHHTLASRALESRPSNTSYKYKYIHMNLRFTIHLKACYYGYHKQLPLYPYHDVDVSRMLGYGENQV